MIAPLAIAMAAAALATLPGCMTTPSMPSRPVLACQDCQGLTYWGPQQPAPEAPGVALGRALIGGAVSIAGYGFAADALKSTTETAANAGRYAVVEQPAPTVVTQPSPTVVEQPQPVVVDPTIVTQPPPVIVEPSYPPVATGSPQIGP